MSTKCPHLQEKQEHLVEQAILAYNLTADQRATVLHEVDSFALSADWPLVFRKTHVLCASLEAGATP